MLIHIKMSLHLTALIFTANLFCGMSSSAEISSSGEISNAPISSVFEAFGYSSSCIASAVTSCEFSSKRNFSINFVLVDVIKSLVQEMKSGRENEKKSNDNARDSWQNITHWISNVDARLQEINIGITRSENCIAEVDNTTNIEAALTEIQRAISEIKETSNCNCENVGEFPDSTNLKRNFWKNCAESKANSTVTSGIRTLYPYGYFNPKVAMVVYCDEITDGGGWTVIQSRSPVPVRERFERGWQEYVQGFGDLNGEFWLGLENIHTLTNSTPMELRIDLEDYEGEKRYAKYEIFHVGDAASKYVLTIGNYSGDAGDDFRHGNGMKFSTKDQDNDIYSKNCAVEFRGAWWFKSCGGPYLNGFQYTATHTSDRDGINWESFRGRKYSLKKVNMKIRPIISV